MKRRWQLGLAALGAAGVTARLWTLPQVPDVDDSFLFVKGVERFSIAETRPHWPGYPVYIWVGKMANAVVGDPVLGLHLLSGLASVLLAWPLAFLTRMWARSLGASEERAVWAGWAAAALWLASPMSWVTGSQIVSDPLGLQFGLVMLALCVRGRVVDSAAAWCGAAIVAGLMVGVRLVNLTMLGPLVWVSWTRRHERWFRMPAPAALLGALLAGVLPWLGWTLWREPAAFVSQGEFHLTGHFTRWGHSLATDVEGWSRPGRALKTLVIYGLGAGMPSMGMLHVVVGLAWMSSLTIAVRRRPWQSRVAHLVALWAVPHLAYVFVAHDVAYPRYMFSAVALLCLVAGLAALSRGITSAVVLILSVVSMVVVSEPLAMRQRQQWPVEYRVARFIADRPRAALAVVDAPDLPFYVGAVAPEVEWVITPPEQIARWLARWKEENRPVFATATPPDPTGWRPVAHFCRDPLINPRQGHDLWLFAPASTIAAPQFDACD